MNSCRPAVGSGKQLAGTFFFNVLGYGSMFSPEVSKLMQILSHLDSSKMKEVHCNSTSKLKKALMTYGGSGKPVSIKFAWKAYQKPYKKISRWRHRCYFQLRGSKACLYPVSKVWSRQCWQNKFLLLIRFDLVLVEVAEILKQSIEWVQTNAESATKTLRDKVPAPTPKTLNGQHFHFGKRGRVPQEGAERFNALVPLLLRNV